MTDWEEKEENAERDRWRFVDKKLGRSPWASADFIAWNKTQIPLIRRIEQGWLIIC